MGSDCISSWLLLIFLLSMSLSHADTCTRQTRTPTYTCTITLQRIWVIQIKIQANTLFFYVGENIIYMITHILLYVSLCRNMLKLNVIYSLWYSKICSTAPLLRENLYQEKSFTDTKQVNTKCEYFPGTIPCRNEIQGLILEVVMMHLELCESILRLRNFWYYNSYKFAYIF